MTKRIGLSRRKTRHRMTKPASAKGKFPIKGFSQVFSVGEKVVLKAEASFHKGLYFRRFHGFTGEVVGIRGKCYEVSLLDGGKPKMVLVNPVHLVRV